MTEPVLVVHGIANHDAQQFKETVRALQSQVGGRFTLIEVFWGDIGGVSAGLKDSLPTIFPHEDGARGDADDSAFLSMLQSQRRAIMGDIVTRAEADAVVESLYHATMLGSGETNQVVRGGMDDDLRQALDEAIPATRFLKNARDPEVHEVVGRLLAQHIRAQQADGFGVSSGGFETRGRLDDAKQAIKSFIGDIDQLIGRVASNVAGSANQWVRGALADPIALTLGDIVAYHQRRAEIHARLFDALDTQAPGYGTPANPITVLAHSLGGLVTFDAALGSDVMDGDSLRQLHIKSWVTFGSQPAFFHVLAPRKGIEVYTKGKPVALPATIGSWTNLWHPLDVLAFAAGTVFRLTGGRVPLDVRVDTPGSEIIDRKVWLHSAYWTSPALLRVLSTC